MPATRIVLSTNSKTLPKPQAESASLFQVFLNKKLLGKALGLGESFELLLLGKREVFGVQSGTTADGQLHERPPTKDANAPTSDSTLTDGVSSVHSPVSLSFLVTDHTILQVVHEDLSASTQNPQIAQTPPNQTKSTQKQPLVLVEQVHSAELHFLKAFVQQSTDSAADNERLPRFTRVLVAGHTRSGKTTVLHRLKESLDREEYEVTCVDFEESGVLSVELGTYPAAVVF